MTHSYFCIKLAWKYNCVSHTIVVSNIDGSRVVPMIWTSQEYHIEMFCVFLYSQIIQNVNGGACSFSRVHSKALCC